MGEASFDHPFHLIGEDEAVVTAPLFGPGVTFCHGHAEFLALVVERVTGRDKLFAGFHIDLFMGDEVAQAHAVQRIFGAVGAEVGFFGEAQNHVVPHPADTEVDGIAFIEGTAPLVMHGHVDMQPGEDVAEVIPFQQMLKTDMDMIGIEHIVGIEKEQIGGGGPAHPFAAGKAGTAVFFHQHRLDVDVGFGPAGDDGGAIVVGGVIHHGNFGKEVGDFGRRLGNAVHGAAQRAFQGFHRVVGGNDYGERWRTKTDHGVSTINSKPLPAAFCRCSTAHYARNLDVRLNIEIRWMDHPDKTNGGKDRVRTGGAEKGGRPQPQDFNDDDSKRPGGTFCHQRGQKNGNLEPRRFGREGRAPKSKRWNQR